MENIYEEIGRRTDGNIYLAVAGPVRTGKSTFVKRFMEELVIPSIDNVYHRERARDELPQSGSGKTITTSEPKFIPETAVEIQPDGATRLRVRLIDSVGYMVDGAIGAEENGQPRMVTTPWYDHEIPLTEAAEKGTKKVMEDHCTIGLIVTTDGSVTDIPREDYLSAEERAIADMKNGQALPGITQFGPPGGSRNPGTGQKHCGTERRAGISHQLPDYGAGGYSRTAATAALRVPGPGAGLLSAGMGYCPAGGPSGEGRPL